MSPLLSDRLNVFVGPYGVRAVRWRRGLRPVGEILFERSCVPDASGGWAPSVAALGQGLSEAGRLRGRAVVTLSNHFIRYAVVPPVPGMRARDRSAVAAHHVRAVYGEAAGRWRVALCRANATRNSLAGAVDAELVPTLVEVLRAAGTRPAAMEPLLASAYNAARRELPGDVGWLAIAEAGRLCVALLRGESWLAVRSQRLTGPAEDALPALLEQVRLSSDADPAPGPVHLAVRGGRADTFVLDAPWSVVPVVWSH